MIMMNNNKMPKLLFLMSLSILTFASGFNNINLDQDRLEGEWKCVSIDKPNSIFSDTLKNEIQGLIKEKDKSSEDPPPYKWAIDFKETGVAEYEPCFGCRKELLDYRVNDNYIIVDQERMEIVKFTSDSLVLSIRQSDHTLVRK